MLRRAAMAATLVAAVALVAPRAAPAAVADPAGHNGRLAFQRNGDLYSIRSDGTGLLRLTTRGGATPRWSADGNRIVFVRSNSVWIMSADGSHQRRLADGWGPALSPDGKSVAFVHPVKEAKCPPNGLGSGPAVIQHIIVMPLAKPTAARSIFSAVACSYADAVDWVTGGLRWSPDGRSILFNEHYGGPHSTDDMLDVVNVSSKHVDFIQDFTCVDESGGGGVPYCPTPNLTYSLDLQPDYAPSGNAIVFVADAHQSGNPQIWAVSHTGQYLTYVGGDSMVGGPVWSPDGTQWAYVQHTPGAAPMIKITAAALSPQPSRTVVVNGAQVDWQPLH